jgi:hypothetical protein
MKTLFSVLHRNFYENGGWKSNAQTIYRVTLMIIRHLMLLLLDGHKLRYFRTSTFPDKAHNVPKISLYIYIFLEKYSFRRLKHLLFMKRCLLYGKMAVRRQLQNGASTTASNFSYIFHQMERRRRNAA